MLIFRMPVVRMPIIFQVNCPHANSPATSKTTKRMLKREEKKNQLKKDSDKMNISETVIRNKYSENSDTKKI